jgi:uncharacterized protein (DUF2336 family)
MSVAPATEKPPLPRIGRARQALLRRLVDVVALPGSVIPPQERAMAGDILLEMLFEADDAARRLCALRLVDTLDAPRRVLRYLGQCRIEVAGPLLSGNKAYDASDLCYLVRAGETDHRIRIAERRPLDVSVGDALVASGDAPAIRALLRNPEAVLSETAMDELVHLSRAHEQLTAAIAARAELRPSQAMAMFWWADGPTRADILNRQSASRQELIENCSDVFVMAAEEGWNDPVTRKTLQLIERRQRNRAAIEKSPFDSLEHAIESAAERGMSPATAQEIGYLAGIKPVTVAKLLSDTGGEGLAVLCKATGLRRDYLHLLWHALKRPVEALEGGPHPLWENVRTLYETISVVKAQTTLRYWNWSMSSSFSPRMNAVKPAADAPPEDEAGSFSTSRRTARLLFGSKD